MTRHGRTPEQWQQLVDVATKSLTRKAELNRLSSYTELNRDIAAKTGQPGFDFSSPEGRNAMGDLLGDAVEKTYPDKRGHAFSTRSLRRCQPARWRVLQLGRQPGTSG